MFLQIVIPFFASTILARLVALKKPKISSFNTYIYFLFLSVNILYSTFSQNILIEQLIFITSATLFFISDIVKNRIIKNTLACFGFIVLAALTLIHSKSLFVYSYVLFVIIAFYWIIKAYKHVVSFLTIQLVPIGLVAIYLTDNNPIFVLTFMALFGAIRFFVESKNNTANPFLTQMFIAILSLFFINKLGSDINSGLSLVGGFSFMLLDFLSRILNKETLISRMYLQETFAPIADSKTLLLNLICLGLSLLVYNQNINMYFALLIVAILWAFLYIKLWYEEKEFS